MVKKTKVYLDGRLVGFHDSPLELINGIKDLRRHGQLDTLINIGFKEDTNEVYINTGAGRLQRPVLTMKDGKVLLNQEHINQIQNYKLKFDDLLKKGLVEYIDADEEDNLYIAIDLEHVTKEHTHLELEPGAIYSLVTSLTPFVEHDMATKALHGAKMYKQGIGFIGPNHYLRTDTEYYNLYYPQKQLVKTKISDIINVDERPIIQNFVVAIIPYFGFNTQDAIVLNKGCVQRGLGRASYYRTYTEREVTYPDGQKEIFSIPNETVKGFLGLEAYKVIGEDSLPEAESYVDRDTVLISKIAPPRFMDSLPTLGLVEEKYEDKSFFIKRNTEGYIDRVYISSSGSEKLLKVKVRTERQPENGDKFSSKHGQKGVVGLLAEETDMPVSTRGIIPDLLLNPTSISSRMTIGDLLEIMSGKVACLRGKEVDGTPFSSEPLDSIKKSLIEQGFRPDGYETFYDGTTGMLIKGEIYVGVIAYRRLYHLVKNKLQARSRGPVQLLTRQPTEGKEKEGGLKFGEMESDCLVGYGAAMLLNEKLVEDSDKVCLPVCNDCGIVAVDDKLQGKLYCPCCNGFNVLEVSMPYSFKLFLDELKSIAIYPKIKIKDLA
ncbi:MAG: DNA-directed RNA polymerase subunit B [Candidatus Diapherotrites archaeon CG08_land_8_20_14_0_20_30_16]|nr:MAG: DNA-directed RNA polymerase subunit B [Candidatus Diapherotrites archaeon CG08_land_8_20_14_0_20_30_16]